MKASAARLLGSWFVFLLCPLATASNMVVIDYDAASTDSASKIDVSAIAAGRLYIQGTIIRSYGENRGSDADGVFGLDLANPLSNTFGASGRFLSGPLDSVARADGSLVSLMLFSGKVVGLDPAGTITMTANLMDPAYDVALQPDGKILVGGTFPPGCHACFTPAAKVTRLNADGTLDATFSSGQIPLGHNVAADQLVTLPDGKIALRGGPSVVLLNGDGTLNTGFGMNSTVTFNAGLTAIGTDTQSRIYALSPPRALQRLLQNGLSDSSFTAGGVDPNVYLSGFAVDSMQRIVVFGEIRAANQGDNGIGTLPG